MRQSNTYLVIGFIIVAIAAFSWVKQEMVKTKSGENISPESLQPASPDSEIKKKSNRKGRIILHNLEVRMRVFINGKESREIDFAKTVPLNTKIRLEVTKEGYNSFVKEGIFLTERDNSIVIKIPFLEPSLEDDPRRHSGYSYKDSSSSTYSSFTNVKHKNKGRIILHNLDVQMRVFINGKESDGMDFSITVPLNTEIRLEVTKEGYKSFVKEGIYLTERDNSIVIEIPFLEHRQEGLLWTKDNYADGDVLKVMIEGQEKIFTLPINRSDPVRIPAGRYHAEIINTKYKSRRPISFTIEVDKKVWLERGKSIERSPSSRYKATYGKGKIILHNLDVQMRVYINGKESDGTDFSKTVPLNTEIKLEIKKIGYKSFVQEGIYLTEEENSIVVEIPFLKQIEEGMLWTGPQYSSGDFLEVEIDGQKKRFGLPIKMSRAVRMPAGKYIGNIINSGNQTRKPIYFEIEMDKKIRLED